MTEFEKIISTLNDRQLEVVDKHDGAVFVDAFAGSGKTAVLSARVGQILSNPDLQVNPESILCVTFSDAGSVAMRQRLLKYIGPTAYKVTVSTFHAFCNGLIKDNLDYFNLRDFEPLSQLEEVAIIEEIIDELAWNHPLTRLTGQKYFDVYRLSNLFNMMKTENMSFDQIRLSCDDYMSSLPFNEDFVYKRGNSKKGIQKGDLNQGKIDAEKEKVDKLVAAAGLFSIYEDKLRKKKRYSFSDMLHLVLKAFNENENLLRDVQERFLYVQVDECIDGESFVCTDGEPIKLKNIHKIYEKNEKLPLVKTYNELKNDFEYKKITKSWSRGDKDVMRITMGGKKKLKCTPNHKILTTRGWEYARDIKVGDIIISSKFSQPFHRELNESQKHFVVSAIIGDGHLSSSSNNNYRMRFIHGEKQKEYLEWKATILGVKSIRVDKNGYAQKPAFKCQTKNFCYRIDREYEISNLTKQSLALLYMDDGSYNGSGVRMYSASSNYDEINLLKSGIKKLGIESGVRQAKSSSTGRTYYYLTFLSKSWDSLFNLIAPYVHKSMDYKVPDEYKHIVGTADWSSQESTRGNICVTKVEHNFGKCKVYDIEVEDNHNFVIGQNPLQLKLGKLKGSANDGIIVHNCQDVNGTQAALIHKILDFWEDANLLMVYDKRQTIYSFAGARLHELKKAEERYNPKIIGLNKNYRSSQLIVDTACKVIANSGPAIHRDEEVQGMNQNDTYVKAIRYQNIAHENAAVVKHIEDLIKTGTPPENIAVLYRKHSLSYEIMRSLIARDIPITTQRKINILDEPIIRQVMAILQYLTDSEKGEKSDLFFQILHYDFLNILRKQIERLLILLRSGKTISDLDARSFATVNRVINLLAELEDDMYNNTVLGLLERLYYKTGIRDIIVGNKDKRKAECLKTFFEFVKEESNKDPEFSVEKLLILVRQMKEHSVSIQIQDVIGADKGVNFATYHGSKGLEFQHVIMIRCNRSDLEKARNPNSNFYMPPNITHSTGDDKECETRRLFFVGMTRAEQYLTMTCSLNDNNGKPMEPSQYLLETELPIHDEKLTDSFDFVLKSLEPDVLKFSPEVEQEKLLATLEHYRLSPTHLNLYLKCPLSFYYQKVLRIPYVARYPAIYGSACHDAINKAFLKKNDSNLENFIEDAVAYVERFGAHLSNKERGRMIKALRSILPGFYEKYFITANKIVLSEYKARDILVDGVPVYGEIDLLSFDQLDADIWDYKTGKPENIKKKMVHNEDYWRQLLFYHLLISEDPRKNWRTRGLGIITIGEEPKYLPLEYDSSDLTLVREQIKEAYNGIKALKFDGCGRDDCEYCTLLK